MVTDSFLSEFILHIYNCFRIFIQISLRGKEKAWTTLTDKDAIVDNDVDKKFPCELPQLDNFKLCPAFVDFDLANWNPDEEDKLYSFSFI